MCSNVLVEDCDSTAFSTLVGLSKVLPLGVQNNQPGPRMFELRDHFGLDREGRLEPRVEVMPLGGRQTSGGKVKENIVENNPIMPSETDKDAFIRICSLAHETDCLLLARCEPEAAYTIGAWMRTTFAGYLPRSRHPQEVAEQGATHDPSGIDTHQTSGEKQHHGKGLDKAMAGRPLPHHADDEEGRNDRQGHVACRHAYEPFHIEQHAETTHKQKGANAQALVSGLVPESIDVAVDKTE